MISLFDRELMRMEQEVRDLKTIHQRGLGTVKFFEKELETTVSSSAIFTATVASGEPANPLAISLAYGEPPLEKYSLAGTNVGLTRWFGSTSGSQNVKIKFISSSDLDEITQS